MTKKLNSVNEEIRTLRVSKSTHLFILVEKYRLGFDSVDKYLKHELGIRTKLKDVYKE